VPRKVTIYSVVTQLLSTGSELNEKKPRKRLLLTEEELDDVSTPLEASLTKSLSFFSLLVWVCKNYRAGWRKIPKVMTLRNYRRT
jgi:hypothetical protein